MYLISITLNTYPQHTRRADSCLGYQPLLFRFRRARAHPRALTHGQGRLPTSSVSPCLYYTFCNTTCVVPKILGSSGQTGTPRASATRASAPHTARGDIQSKAHPGQEESETRLQQPGAPRRPTCYMCPTCYRCRADLHAAPTSRQTNGADAVGSGEGRHARVPAELPVLVDFPVEREQAAGHALIANSLARRHCQTHICVV